jgi:hypothetical protein
VQAGDVQLGTIFSDTHRYEIPYFQRPYVWTAERNWAPLWEDIQKAADEVIREMDANDYPEEPSTYFLGAIVVKDTPRHPQRLSGSSLIDGQQRLTTLQVLLAAARAIAAETDARSAFGRFDRWLRNDPDSVHESFPDDRYKLQPLPQDREEYTWAVRGPGEELSLSRQDHALVQARVWFEKVIRDWAGSERPALLLDALHSALRERMVLVRITLEKSDNAQIIFEALNHRGVELSDADLVKNYLFRLVDENPHERSNAEQLLMRHWLPLDGPVWRREFVTGRIRRSRLDILVGYWLTVQKQDVVSVDNLFEEFKSWLQADGDLPASEVIQSIRRYADLYDDLLNKPRTAVTRRFIDHMTTTRTNTAWPLVLRLHTTGAPKEQIDIALVALDSFLMRRAICGLKTGDYNRFFTSLIKTINTSPPTEVGEAVETALLSHTAETRSWPSDDEFRSAVINASFYSLVKPRIRAFFTGVENHLRSDSLTDSASFISASDERLNIEHVLPQRWETHWPLAVDSPETRLHREHTLQTAGNLTLTNGKLNSKLQNGSWGSKAPALREKSTLLITTASILSPPAGADQRLSWGGAWGEEFISERSEYLANTAIATWPRPHRTVASVDEPSAIHEGQAEDEDDDEMERPASAGPQNIDTIFDLDGFTIDLDVLYRSMWDQSEIDEDGLRIFNGHRADVVSVKHLLADLFGVPVADGIHPVNDRIRTESRARLSALGWATKQAGHNAKYNLHRTL